MNIKKLLVFAAFLLSCLFAFAQPSGGSTNPTAYNGWPTNYTFATWANTNAAGTYPTNAIFWRTNTNDPGINSSFNADYTGAYNGSSGSRMNGEAANGVSWTNTGTAGNLGGMVVSLNTTGRQTVVVSSTGRMLSTLTYNASTQNRFYAIRLFYRVGTSGAFTAVSPTAEFTSNATATSYRANGSSGAINATLPAACDNQSVVQVLWYFYQQGGSAGSRPVMAIDDITIASSASSATSITTGAVSTSPFCVSANNAATGTVAYTSTGTFTGTFTAKLIGSDGTTVVNSNIGTGASPISITIPAGTTAGTYYVRVDNNTPATTGSNSSAITVNSLANVTGAGATAGNAQADIAWTNPNCFDNVLIVRHTSSIAGTPSGTYAVNDAFPGGGTVVYSGQTSPQTFTGLTNGTQYFFKIFAFKGTSTRDYTSGVQVTATPAPLPSLNTSVSSLSGFSTPQGTASTSQSYTLTGSNLTPANATITVTAPANFQVSNDNSTWGNSTTATASGGSVSQIIYARISASASAGSVSGNITHSGGGVSTPPTVALSGTVTIPPPSIVINKFNITTNEVELLVIQNNLDMRGMVIKDFSSGGDGDGGGKFNVSTNAIWSSVPAGTLIHITDDAVAADVTSADFTLKIGRSNTTYFTSQSGTWDLENNALVMIKTSGSSQSGVGGNIHCLTTGTVGGTQFQAATGNKLLCTTSSSSTLDNVFAVNSTSSLNDYNGTNASVQSTDLVMLQPNNNTNAIYICSLRNGGTTQPTAAATSMTFTGVGPNDITVNWVNPVSGGGARRIVVARLQATAAVAPTDGQVYTANAVFGSGSTTGTNNFVVYDGTGTSVAVSGLASGTVYSFDVYEYNGTDFCTNYFGTPLTGNRNTTSATTVQFVSATATVSEGVGTYNVVLSITNPSASVATTGQINFLSTDPLTTGQAADINNFNIGTFTFPANSSANQTVTITVTDDALTESTEDFVFDLQNVAGGVNAQEGITNSFLLSITDNDAAGTIIYSTASGNANTDPIWSYNAGGPGQTITSLVPGGFSATAGKDFVIQAGHTVSCPSGTIYNMNNLTVQATAKLWAAQTTINTFVNLFGNATVDGAFGNNLTAADALGINFAGTNCTLSGNGVVNASRFKKPIVTDLPASNPTVTPTTAANINMNVNLWFGGTCIMNEGANGSNFNLTIAAGKTVTVQATNGNVAIDGTLGTGSGNNGGTYTINGTLNINGILYAKNDNTAGTVAFVISNTGTINAKTVNADLNNGSIPTTFTIAANGKLNVTGALNLISGTLTSNSNIFIKSSASAQAYIDDFTPGYNGTISGNVKVERYITSGPNGFRYIGAPVNNGGGVMNLSSISGFVISGVPGQIIPLAGCPSNPANVSQNSPYGTFMRWEEAGPYGSPACRLRGWWFQTSGSMALGRGYGAKLSGGNIVTYTGAANTGNSPAYTCTNTNVFSTTLNGWNLVSNTYPSGITIDNTDGNANNNMPTGFDGQIQFYQTSGPYTGAYLAINVGTSPANIALGQGFWVRVSNVGTANWTLTDNYRVTGSPTYYNSNSVVDHHLKIDISGNGFMDKTDVNFKANAETGRDFYDADKWESRAEQPTLYTLIGSDHAAINSLPSLTEAVSIPMGVKPGTSGNFTLTFDDVASFPQSAMLYLEDLKENTMTDIRANNTYAFTANVSDNPDRFMLHFKPGVQVEVADQDCDNAGSIEVVQPSSTVWSAYNLKDNNGAIYAQGTNFSGSITVSGLQPQEYILTLTHPSGYVAQEFITVNGSPVVTADFTASASNVQVDEPVSFTATTTNANQLVWNFGDGTIVTGNGAIQHTYDANGTYNVTLTAQNDVCNDVAQKVITVGTTTGIDNDAANGLKIYGQGDHLIIELANMATGIANLTMYNMLGQKVESFTGISTINGRSEITLKNVKPGYYSVQVVAGNQVFNQKVYLSAN